MNLIMVRGAGPKTAADEFIAHLWDSNLFHRCAFLYIFMECQTVEVNLCAIELYKALKQNGGNFYDK
jgi:hypothetical protein